MRTTFWLGEATGRWVLKYDLETRVQHRNGHTRVGGERWKDTENREGQHVSRGLGYLGLAWTRHHVLTWRNIALGHNLAIGRVAGYLHEHLHARHTARLI